MKMLLMLLTLLIINISVSTQLKAQNSMQIHILSKDYSIAKKALDIAIDTKDKPTICFGIKTEFLEIRRDVVQAMKDLKEKEFVPCLIAGLNYNQQPYRGGTESQRLQQALNLSIVDLLEQLTGLELFVFENLPVTDLSKDDIKRILKESQEWWKIHQGKDK